MTDLAHYLRPVSRSRVPMLAGTALLAAFAMWLGQDAMSQHQFLQVLEQQSEQLRRVQAIKPAPKASRAELDEQKQWAALEIERSFSWTPLFSALEATGNPNIELLQFQPDKRGQLVTLQGEAKDEASLVAFMEALSDQRALRHVHLRHRKVKHRDRLTTLAFEIRANIQP